MLGYTALSLHEVGLVILCTAPGAAVGIFLLGGRKLGDLEVERELEAQTPPPPWVEDDLLPEEGDDQEPWMDLAPGTSHSYGGQ